MLRRAGAQTVPIGRCGDGIDLGALEKYLETAGRTDRPAFLYVMPSFHNPTGTTMPVPDRERLADLSIRHELLLVEDDPYGQLRFDGESPASLHSLLTARGAGHLTVFTSSFSKIIAPGLRVGYGVLPQHLAEPVTGAAAEAYVSPPMWPQACCDEFLAAGFLPTHLARAREMLRQRRDTLVGRANKTTQSKTRQAPPDHRRPSPAARPTVRVWDNLNIHLAPSLRTSPRRTRPGCAFTGGRQHAQRLRKRRRARTLPPICICTNQVELVVSM